MSVLVSHFRIVAADGTGWVQLLAGSASPIDRNGNGARLVVDKITVALGQATTGTTLLAVAVAFGQPANPFTTAIQAAGDGQGAQYAFLVLSTTTGAGQEIQVDFDDGTDHPGLISPFIAATQLPPDVNIAVTPALTAGEVRVHMEHHYIPGG